MLPGEEYTRIHFIGDYNPRIRFVVFQQYVVSGLVLLYHGVLQIECVLLGRYDNIFHVGDIAHQNIGAQHVVMLCEIGIDAPLQILGLADVYYSAVGVEVHVYARCFGQNGKFFLKCF